MELIWFALAAYGMTQILCYGKIFDAIRPDYYLFHCSMCMGFWSGGFLFGINGLTELFSFDYNLINFLICGWLSSGTSYVFGQTFGDEGINVKRT